MSTQVWPVAGFPGAEGRTITAWHKIEYCCQVIGASLAALLLGWLLLAVLEQRTPYARTLWISLALVGLAASVALPLTVATTVATTASAVVGLVVMHLTIGAAVIPVMARTARAR